MRVKDLMSYPVFSMKPEATVQEAIEAMVQGRKGGVLVCTEGLLKGVLGIVTAGEIFRKVFLEDRDPREVRVTEIMTPAPLVTISPNATAHEASELMIRHNIRRLPVVEGGALVGMITSKDLLRCVR